MTCKSEMSDNDSAQTRKGDVAVRWAGSHAVHDVTRRPPRWEDGHPNRALRPGALQTERDARRDVAAPANQVAHGCGAGFLHPAPLRGLSCGSLVGPSAKELPVRSSVLSLGPGSPRATPSVQPSPAPSTFLLHGPPCGLGLCGSHTPSARPASARAAVSCSLTPRAWSQQ